MSVISIEIYLFRIVQLHNLVKGCECEWERKGVSGDKGVHGPFLLANNETDKFDASLYVFFMHLSFPLSLLCHSLPLALSLFLCVCMCVCVCRSVFLVLAFPLRTEKKKVKIRAK